MKQIIITIVISLSIGISVVANTYSYSYDSAGNRVRREIILETISAQEFKKKIIFSEHLSGKEIKIYPNPTSGDLSMEIIGFEDSDDCEFQIFDLSGKFVVSERAINNITKVDISSQTKGIYILHVLLNGEESTWKIIKK